MKKFLILFVISFFFIFPKNAFSQGNFSTDYSVTYTIKNDAQTHVDLNIVLTNLTDKYYASSYDISVGFSDIRNAKAKDPDGDISPKITKNEEGNVIELVFNTKNLGLGSKLNFNLSFDTNEIAQSLGNVWDVNIPGISIQNDFSSFNVVVVYPTFLGKPTFIKPQLAGAKNNITGNTITFTKEDLGSSGISLAFGDFQIFDFNLLYHLENKNVSSVRTEIALPPTTNYQDIYIQNITPRPENVVIDKDGNWLASFVLSPSQSHDVNVQGQAKVYLRPRPEELTNEKARQYLKKSDYWQVENAEIKKLAKELKTPKSIYDYIVSNLTYDYSRVEKQSPRLGALGSLKNPDSAVCLEFTDLYVTLARAAGIPARAVEGFAYTDNSFQRPLSLVKDILHAWPEYYDFKKRAWIMVDPTWGNTTGGVDYFNTLDFDHLTFVVKGQESTYPIPAGGYKLEGGENSKDVDVTIAKQEIKPSSNVSVSFDAEQEFIAGLPISGKIKIANNGNSLLSNSTAYVYSEKLPPLTQSLNTPSIPPFGSSEVSFSLNKTSFLTKKESEVKIAVANNFSQKTIKVLPFFLSRWFILGGVAIVSFTTVLSLTFAIHRRISVYRQRKQSDLRGKSEELKEKSF